MGNGGAGDDAGVVVHVIWLYTRAAAELVQATLTPDRVCVLVEYSNWATAIHALQG